MLDPIAPNITNKQQSKWSPSPPLVGIVILVPGAGLLCTTLDSHSIKADGFSLLYTLYIIMQQVHNIDSLLSSNKTRVYHSGKVNHFTATA